MAAIVKLENASQIKKLPSGGKFLGGIGWDDTPGSAETDLDVAIVRYKDNGTVEAAWWGKKEWYRPELGVTKSGRPVVQSPEEDLRHSGDATSGQEAKEGYDEHIDVDPTKAPSDTNKYFVVISNWVDPSRRDPNNPPILGNVQNPMFGMQQEGSPVEFVVPVADEHVIYTTVVQAVIERHGDGWALRLATDADVNQYGMSSIGTSDDLLAVLSHLGVNVQADYDYAA